MHGHNRQNWQGLSGAHSMDHATCIAKLAAVHDKTANGQILPAKPLYSMQENGEDVRGKLSLGNQNIMCMSGSTKCDNRPSSTEREWSPVSLYSHLAYSHLCCVRPVSRCLFIQWGGCWHCPTEVTLQDHLSEGQQGLKGLNLHNET